MIKDVGKIDNMWQLQYNMDQYGVVQFERKSKKVEYLSVDQIGNAQIEKDVCICVLQ